jgi:ATP-binding cassette subfamily B protein
VLFQDFNKYEDSFKSNIGYGKAAEEYNISDIITASVKANASDMIEKFDKKYDQVLGRLFDEGIELSGGQWQKVALARAFFRNAPILVLDEPTASIDAKAESEIFDQVEKLSRDKTVIIISHRFSTVRNADRIIVIDKGKVIESGSHEALIKQKGRYAKLFQLQAKGYQ